MVDLWRENQGDGSTHRFFFMCNNVRFYFIHHGEHKERSARFDFYLICLTLCQKSYENVTPAFVAFVASVLLTRNIVNLRTTLLL